MAPRKLHILDLGFDNLEKIFRVSKARDRCRLRRVCRDFNEVFPYSWGHVKGIRGSVIQEHHRGLVEYLLRWSGKYIKSMCMNIRESHLSRTLAAGEVCTRLETLCCP